MKITLEEFSKAYDELGVLFKKGLNNLATEEQFHAARLLSQVEEYIEGETSDEENQDEELDSGYYHEALDRTEVVRTIIETTLSDHPVFIQSLHLKTRVEAIQDILGEIYMEIGSLIGDKLLKEDQIRIAEGLEVK